MSVSSINLSSASEVYPRIPPNDPTNAWAANRSQAVTLFQSELSSLGQFAVINNPAHCGVLKFGINYSLNSRIYNSQSDSRKCAWTTATVKHPIRAPESWRNSWILEHDQWHHVSEAGRKYDASACFPPPPPPPPPHPMPPQNKKINSNFFFASFYQQIKTFLTIEVFMRNMMLCMRHSDVGVSI